MSASETIASRTGACQRCHRRKVRCDRKRPSCAPCARLNAQCQYAPREHQVQLRRQDVERLEQRLRRLEADNASLSTQLSAARQQSGESHSQGRATASPAGSTTTDARAAAFAPSLLGLGLHSGQAEPRPPNGNDEVANQVIHLSLSAGGGRNFVGSTSGLFLANLLQPQSQPVTLLASNQPSSTQVASNQGIDSTPGQTRQRVVSSPLPPKALAAEIIEAYCNHDRLHYPFLDPRDLHAALENVYAVIDGQGEGGGSGQSTPFDVFLINMTLAIGTAQVYKLNWNGIWDAEISYDRAAVHLADVLAQGGIKALQALLLVCQYRMGTPSQDTTGSVWHLIGVAARMCFELGLHRASAYGPTRPGQGQPSEAQDEVRRAENEVKKRCFWSVVAMDRMASLVLGRPLAIQLDDIDVDLPYVDPEALRKASLADSATQSLAHAAYGSTEWYLSTAIFVHIVRYRLICGKILNALHRTSVSQRESPPAYEAIRDDLVKELREWHVETSSLPLVGANASPISPASRSSFRSQEWYDLLYHNGILMLFRPSPSLCDASRNNAALQHVYDSSQSAISLYASLHRTGRINYSWVTLHSVFIAGLSYIYALRNHLQHLQSREHSHENTHHVPTAFLRSTPTINQVVNATRACSKVLVAVSERWAVARSCSEVFDKLSDAVVADVVDNQMSDAATSSPATARAADSQQGNPASFTPSGMEGVMNDHAVGEAGLFSMTVDNTLRDCFGDLQSICYDQYHSDAIVQLSQDWLVGLGETPERYI